jgi:hypothetical protein
MMTNRFSPAGVQGLLRLGLFMGAKAPSVRVQTSCSSGAQGGQKGHTCNVGGARGLAVGSVKTRAVLSQEHQRASDFAGWSAERLS